VTAVVAVGLASVDEPQVGDATAEVADGTPAARERSLEPAPAARSELVPPATRVTEAAGTSEPAAVVAPPVFARVEGLDLHLPAEAAVLVGFHEAATRRPLALTPIGGLLDHQNTTKFDPPPDEDGMDYVVLSSRGRPMPATSAADIVLTDEVPVLAPVDGTVTDVRTYYLSGRHLDHRVEIRPASAPHLRVVLIHVEEPTVAVGQEVSAGQTVLSPRVRTFPFSSHIDRYTEPDRFGHVHLEVHAPVEDVTD
jgi:biotin carboxyl carrier protein